MATASATSTACSASASRRPQVEEPETWLRQSTPGSSSVPRPLSRSASAGGCRGRATARSGSPPTRHRSAYDTPIVGWRGWANTLRLWSAKPTHAFDLERFNQGDFAAAAEPEALARTISRVLYPDDTTEQGKELRLKQEYFFTAASLRDILRRFEGEYDDLRKLPQKVAIQLNDTHPAIAGRSWCACCMTRTASISRTRSRSRRRLLSTTPTTRSCPRRWSAGPRADGQRSCRAI
jgi:glucan phosphorylase